MAGCRSAILGGIGEQVRNRGGSVGFRPDIEGLRGVAVLAVVLFHAGVTAVAGGFVGVDVFFVMSGFLITGILLREVERTGTVRLGAFWARRARRLVPGMAVVLLATLVGSLVVFSALQWKTVAHHALASATYVSNLVFAARSEGYFEVPAVESPFLHTWSLAVEEQFYLVWPLVFVAVGKVRWRRLSLRTAVGSVLGVGLVASLTLSWVLSASGTPFAFYSSPTRAWEFAAGGVLAILVAGPDPTTMDRRPAWSHRAGVATASGLAGLVLLAIAVVTFDGLDPYPGILAVVPVAATVLLLAAGSSGGPNPVTAVLSVAPLRSLGRVSYAWYLWHWPVIVLARQQWPGAGAGWSLAAAAVSLVLAWVTTALVEDPVRFRPSLTASVARTYLVTGTATATVAAASVLVLLLASTVVTHPPLDGLQRLQAERAETGGPGCVAAGSDALELCTLGDLDAAVSVLLLGDSHAGHLRAGLDAAGKAMGIRVVSRTANGCPAADLPIRIDGTRRVRDCAAVRRHNAEALREGGFAGVLVSQADYAGRVLGADGGDLSVEQELAGWRTAVGSLLDDIGRAGAAATVVLPSPVSPVDPVECTARRGGDACAMDRSEVEARRRPFATLVEQASVEAGASTFDPLTFACGPDRCPVEADGIVRYIDPDHFSRGFVAGLGPVFAPVLCALVEAAPPGPAPGCRR